MRDIRIDDDVYRAIQRLAVPLEDDANSVLRRLLGLDAAPASDGAANSGEPVPDDVVRRARRGELLSSRLYEIPLLEAIEELGGSAPTAEVLRLLEKKIGPMLTPLDRGIIQSGVLRWKNRAQFVRLRLVNTGELARDSEHGIWTLTERGRQRLAEERRARARSA